MNTYDRFTTEVAHFQLIIVLFYHPLTTYCQRITVLLIYPRMMHPWKYYKKNKTLDPMHGGQHCQVT